MKEACKLFARAELELYNIERADERTNEKMSERACEIGARKRSSAFHKPQAKLTFVSNSSAVGNPVQAQPHPIH